MHPINFCKQWRKRQRRELRIIQLKIEQEKRANEYRKVTQVLHRESTSALENLQRTL